MADGKASTQKRYIVVNGDDFGFSSGVNRAIIQAHTHGILTSTSLMVTGAAFEEAVELARSHPKLGVGLHVVLTCGKSVLAPDVIPQLVNSTGYFPEDPAQAGLIYQFQPAAQQQLRAEIRAQLERFQQTGLPLSHVDGHLHLHCHPVILRILSELASEFGIRTIRLPFEEIGFTLQANRPQTWSKLLMWSIFWQLRRFGSQMLRSRKIRYLDRVYGLLHTGEISEDYLLQLIPKIQADRVELYAHPAFAQPDEPLNGPPGSGELELTALQSQNVHHALLKYGFELTNFLELEGI